MLEHFHPLFLLLQAAASAVVATAQAAGQVATSAVPHDLKESPLTWTIGTAGIIVWCMEFAKNHLHFWPFNYITADSERSNKIVAAVLGLFTATAITMNISGTSDGGHVITVAIPAVAVISKGLVHFAAQIMFQQGFYKLNYKVGKQPPG